MGMMLNALELRSRQECSSRVWLSFGSIFVILMLNYMALIIPEMLIAMLICAITCYSVIALIGYLFYLRAEWQGLLNEVRFGRILYGVVLMFVNVFNVTMLIKIASSSMST